jgi:hypothetical protein
VQVLRSLLAQLLIKAGMRMDPQQQQTIMQVIEKVVEAIEARLLCLPFSGPKMIPIKC